MLTDQDNVCEFCGGTGEIDVMENDGEGHLEPVGKRACICQAKDDDEL